MKSLLITTILLGAALTVYGYVTLGGKKGSGKLLDA